MHGTRSKEVCCPGRPGVLAVELRGSQRAVKDAGAPRWMLVIATDSAKNEPANYDGGDHAHQIRGQSCQERITGFLNTD